MTIVERVAKGAAWLDQRDPNWRSKIDPDKLYMADACKCVLGQLFKMSNSRYETSGFSLAQLTYNMSISQLIDMGFESSGATAEYNELEEEWRKQL